MISKRLPLKINDEKTSDHISVLSNQNAVLVGHNVHSRKKNYLQPCDKILDLCNVMHKLYKTLLFALMVWFPSNHWDQSQGGQSWGQVAYALIPVNYPFSWSKHQKNHKAPQTLVPAVTFHMDQSQLSPHLEN